MTAILPLDRRLAQVAGETISFPESYDEWLTWYDRREKAYLHDPYDLLESKAWRLFRAFDPNGDVIAETRRITRDIQHVVDAGATAISGGRQRLDAAGDSALQAAADAVWKRSDWARWRGVWAKWCANMGRAGIEAVRTDGREDKTALVVRDPRSYRVTYDQTTGSEIERVVISITFWEPEQIDPALGILLAGESVPHTYVRVLDRENIAVYLDGDLVEEESGPHRLGEVPFVNCIALPHNDSEHGLWVGHGMDSALAFYDSVQTQVGAIGNRFADPQLVGRGVRFGEGSEVSRFGRMIGIPAEASVSYLEPSFTQLQHLLASAQEARLAARESLPEFIFAGAGANSSGEALRLRADAFVAKYVEIRSRLYPALARATDYATHMDARTPYDRDSDRLTVDADPVLRPDAAAELAALESADKLQAISAADKVRGVQRLGLIPADVDPDAYAAELEDRGADRALQFFGAASDDADTASRVVDPTLPQDAPPVATSPADEPAANTALNGAQVGAARNIITAVAAGELPRETGVQMLVSFFNLPAPVAEAVMGAVGRSFVPASAEAHSEGEE